MQHGTSLISPDISRQYLFSPKALEGYGASPWQRCDLPDHLPVNAEDDEGHTYCKEIWVTMPAERAHARARSPGASPRCAGGPALWDELGGVDRADELHEAAPQRAVAPVQQ